jgi:hypothetical protein
VFARKMASLGRIYKSDTKQDAHIIFEANGPGIIFGNTIYNDCGYRNLWYRRQEMNTNKEATDHLGWSSSRELKRLVFGEWHRALMDGLYIEREMMVIEEARSYRYAAGGAIEPMSKLLARDTSGAAANHGDRVISSALAWWAMKHRNVKIITKPDIPENCFKRVLDDCRKEDIVVKKKW